MTIYAKFSRRGAVAHEHLLSLVSVPGRHTRPAVCLFLVCLVGVSLFGGVIATVTPASGTVYCDKGTGIAEAGDDEWMVTSWRTHSVYGPTWQRADRTEVRGWTYGVASGPDDSLWALKNDSVVRLRGTLQTRTGTALENWTVRENAEVVDRDLAFGDRWLVLSDGRLTAYDANWSTTDTTPPEQRLVPENATGVTATDDRLLFVTRNGTVHAYRSTETGYEQAEQFSVDINGTAVDVHLGTDGRWLLLQGGNVTVVTDDGERLAQPKSFFRPSCEEPTGLAFRPILYAASVLSLAVMALGAVFVLSIIAVVILYVVSRR